MGTTERDAGASNGVPIHATRRPHTFDRTAARNLLVLLVAAFVAMGALSCASSAESEAQNDPKPPPGSPLAKIELGMNDTEVRNAIGDPDDTNMYMTGKQWIPFYYGPDTHRSDWMYSGVGRVVFSRNRYSGALKVIRIIPNPDEP